MATMNVINYATAKLQTNPFTFESDPIQSKKDCSLQRSQYSKIFSLHLLFPVRFERRLGIVGISIIGWTEMADLEEEKRQKVSCMQPIHTYVRSKFLLYLNRNSEK